jgi:hypothetical protein
MIRGALFCAVAALVLAAPVSAGPIVGECFTVHGRLGLGNGTPGFRIWKVGTGRSLGVFDCDGKAEGSDLLPASVKRVTGKNFSHEVFADFEVCPLSKEKPGERQRVCIRDAHNLVPGRPAP